MNIKLVDGRLSLDIIWVLENLTNEEKVDLIETLSCEDAVINHISDQIIRGYTDQIYCGLRSLTISPDPTTALDKAIREISKASSELARKEIERLEEELKNVNKKYYDLLYKRDEI